MKVILPIFSGISFLFFGIACLTNEYFIAEFVRYGLADFRKIVGFFELLGGTGCLIGLLRKEILIISSVGLSILMIMGVCVRFYIEDTFLQTLPAITYLLINILIFIPFLGKKLRV